MLSILVAFILMLVEGAKPNNGQRQQPKTQGGGPHRSLSASNAKSETKVYAYDRYHNRKVEVKAPAKPEETTQVVAVDRFRGRTTVVTVPAKSANAPAAAQPAAKPAPAPPAKPAPAPPAKSAPAKPKNTKVPDPKVVDAVTKIALGAGVVAGAGAFVVGGVAFKNYLEAQRVAQLASRATGIALTVTRPPPVSIGPPRPIGPATPQSAPPRPPSPIRPTAPQSAPSTPSSSGSIRTSLDTSSIPSLPSTPVSSEASLNVPSAFRNSLAATAASGEINAGAAGALAFVGTKSAGASVQGATAKPSGLSQAQATYARTAISRSGLAASQPTTAQIQSAAKQGYQYVGNGMFAKFNGKTNEGMTLAPSTVFKVAGTPTATQRGLAPKLGTSAQNAEAFARATAQLSRAKTPAEIAAATSQLAALTRGDNPTLPRAT